MLMRHDYPSPFSQGLPVRLPAKVPGKQNLWWERDSQLVEACLREMGTCVEMGSCCCWVKLHLSWAALLKSVSAEDLISLTESVYETAMI